MGGVEPYSAGLRCLDSAPELRSPSTSKSRVKLVIEASPELYHHYRRQSIPAINPGSSSISLRASSITRR